MGVGSEIVVLINKKLKLFIDPLMGALVLKHRIILQGKMIFSV